MGMFGYKDFGWISRVLPENPQHMQGDVKLVREVLPAARIVLLKGVGPTGWEKVSDAPNDVPLDLPFENTWIELFDKSIEVSKLEPDIFGPDELFIKGLLVYERSFCDYAFVFFTPGKGGSLRASVYSKVATSPEALATYYQFKNLVRTLLATLNDKDNIVGVVETNAKENLQVTRSGAFRTGYVTRTLVVCTPKRGTDPLVSIPGAKKEVDFSHRWEVRGHWRKCSHIGRDRSGDYCIDGYTWVPAYQKGPEGKPLIVKKRLVIC